ncbi:cbb3-type cytochrome oxidase assembly protein CcoS [Aestuariibius sp. 2305UL40-4]|uniref:cbb3-type cytochrome oxidase assembly protein CcoS n=1 Tax=Aestuariibius violaceus TaxID=3234132 RepID=UPI00345E78F6
MSVLAFLIPVSLVLGLGALAAFVWAMRNHQYDDMERGRHSVLDDRHDDAPGE